MMLQAARKQAGLTQREVAARLGVTQAYLSMLENGRRALPARLRTRASFVLNVSPTVLPLVDTPALSADRVAQALGALGYEGFGYVKPRRRMHPAVLLLGALRNENLEGRLVEALPWVARTFADMDWSWLASQARLHDLQNRLGYVVMLARTLAEKAGDAPRVVRLSAVEQQLGRSRLAREDTLCRASMTQAERRWLRSNRPSSAALWNLLTNLSSEFLTHAG